MASDPRPELPPELVSDTVDLDELLKDVKPYTGGDELAIPDFFASDKVDLDELFKYAKPVGDGSDWASPSFFESDEEQQEFVAWYRAERQKDIA